MAKVKDPSAITNKVIREYASRNPAKIARMNGILIRTIDNWMEQSGAYNDMEYEANVFAAQLLLPEVLAIIYHISNAIFKNPMPIPISK
ncbi:MAG: hypothetical protein HFE63_06890 [Clostridiales bacterium]|nr:hypothetical protein [Clostridiales bacterium]